MAKSLAKMATAEAKLDDPDGKASTIKTTFNRETSVSININSTPSIIWKLLTDAPGMPHWNSTVVSINGEIAPGNTINLKSTLDENRTFKLKIKEFEPERRLVWGDGKGNRTYTIGKNVGGSLTFSMKEKIGGLMFPMYSRFIPPFDESFEQFAADLKKEAELIYKTRS